LPPRGGEKPEGIKTPPQRKESTSNITIKEKSTFHKNTLYKMEDRTHRESEKKKLSVAGVNKCDVRISVTI